MWRTPYRTWGRVFPRIPSNLLLFEKTIFLSTPGMQLPWDAIGDNFCPFCICWRIKGKWRREQVIALGEKSALLIFPVISCLGCDSQNINKPSYFWGVREKFGLFKPDWCGLPPIISSMHIISTFASDEMG